MNNVHSIVRRDWCVSCGACVHICPLDNIGMSYSVDREKWDISIHNPELCKKCDGSKFCLNVCPSANVSSWKDYGGYENGNLGRIINVYNGYSRDQECRYKASSGGFVRTLAKELLSEKKINGVISLVHTEGFDYSVECIQDISLMPNSVYHNINYEGAVDKISNNKGVYLVVGLPCQIASLYLLARHHKWSIVQSRIFLSLALMCGYVFERHIVKAFSCLSGFPAENISYRTGGRFRRTCLIAKNGQKILDMQHSQNIQQRINTMLLMDPFLAQNGCLRCIDHLGYCADIVVGDAWQDRYARDAIGTNIILTRTSRGDAEVLSLKNFFFEPGTISEVFDSQGEEYACGLLGRTMRRYNREFSTQDILAISSAKRVLGIKAKMKIKYIKRLLCHRHYRAASLLYMLLESRVILLGVMRFIVRKIINANFCSRFMR